MLDPFSLLDEEHQSPGELRESIQEAPRETVWAFVLAVLLAQAGLLCVSLGLLFIGFQGRWTFGGGLFAVGILALVTTALVYLWHRGGAE